MARSSSRFDRFFEDKHGHVVIWQDPNYLLYGWLICRLVSFFIRHRALGVGLSWMGTAFLIIWAYLEFTQGSSPFRKVLGLLVFIFILLNLVL